MASPVSYQINRVSGPTLVNQDAIGDETYPTIVSLSGGVSAAFFFDGALGGRVAGQLIGSTGAPMGAQLTVSGSAIYDVPHTQSVISAARLNDGNIVVSWADNQSTNIVHYRIVDPNLNGVTGDITLPAFGGTSNIHPDVAALSDGGFVIAFEVAYSTTDHDIVAHRYDASGNAVGSYIGVNTSSPTVDQLPSVIGLTGGGFAVAHERLTGTTRTMYDSVFDANGVVADADTLFDNVGDTNAYANVVALPNGGYMVSYLDNQYSPGNYDITAARFDAGGHRSPSVGVQATSSADFNSLPDAAISPDGFAFIANQDNSAANNSASLLAPDGSLQVTDLGLDPNDGAGRAYPSVTWIDASHVMLVEANSGGVATGGDGSGYAVDSQVFHVVRHTHGFFNQANNFDFSTTAIDNLFDGNVNIDTFRAGAGNDTLNGGAGDDFLYGNAGDDQLNGGAGDDYLDGGPGVDTMAGGTGDDTYIVDDPGDVVVENPGEGTDTVYASASTYTLAANVENLVGTVNTPQTFTGNASFDIITLGSGNDTVQAGSGGSYIIGNGGNDVLLGGAGGGAGGLGNTIYAFGGNDYLQGGAGSPSDVLVATGAGNDTFYGGSGNNYIVGGTGQNAIVAGPNGLESLYSSGTADYMVGGGTSCVLSEQGTGNDTLFGGLNSNNYIVGSNGNDLLVGGGLSDYIFAGNGNTTMYGGNGTDYIYTGSGTDFIWTDNIGSASTDYIYETPTSGTNTIADFKPGDAANHDVLVLSGTNLHSFADVQAHAAQGPNSPYTVISASATDQIYLYNVQPFQLTANDFIFT